MGEAKKRGPEAVRIAEGIAKRQAEEQRRKKEAAAREAALTPAQRQKRQEARMLLATISGMAASAIHGRRPY